MSLSNLNIQAVVAHFRDNSELEESFYDVLVQASKICSKVFLISTSPVNHQYSWPTNIFVIERENIGYDFCSYRFGIELHADLTTCDRLLLFNNSFFFSNSFNLPQILSSLEQLDDNIGGITSNDQFFSHLQSAFLYFKKSAIMSNWFSEFWGLVQPLQVKKDIIVNFEIGLTKTALARGLSCGSLFGPKIDKFGAKSSFIQKLLKRFGLGISKEPGNPFFNKTEDVYRRFGLLKWEYLKNKSKEGVELPSFISPIDRQKITKSFDTDDAKKHSAFGERFQMSASAASWLVPLQERDKFLERRHSSIGVVLHLFYPELLPEIIEQLRKIPEHFDLIITVTNTENALFAKSLIRETLLLDPIIVIVENRGRDVFPFVQVLNLGLLEKYQLICKIHSKKSLYSSKGGQWRQELLSELFGSTANIINILNEFRTDPTLGICGPSKAYLTQPEYWGANRERLQSLAQQLGFKSNEVPLRFFAGTMFWIRAEVLAKLAELNLAPQDFEEEWGQQDGTLAHALERLFLLLAEQSGFQGKTCGLKFMELTDSSGNKPIVYK